jgi:hypothetical protein
VKGISGTKCEPAQLESKILYNASPFSHV